MITRPCKLVITDEINCYMTGLKHALLAKLESDYKYKVPDANFSPLYKLGRWDGYFKLFNNGQYYNNLLDDEFFQTVESHGYRLEVEDRRRSYERDLQYVDENRYTHIYFKGEPMVLREVQVNTINACVDSPTGMIIAATGAGKTVSIAAIADLYRHMGRVMVVVPSVDLASQTLETFATMELPDIGEFHGDGKTTENIIVGTWQSLIRYPEAIEGVVCIIADECHEYDAKEMFEFLTVTARDVPFRYGFTGTLPKDELAQQQLKAVLGEVLYTKAAHELQDEGILAHCYVNIIQTQEDESLKLKEFHDEQSFLLGDPKRKAYLSDLIAQISGSGNTLVIIDPLDLGEYFKLNIPNCTFVNGAMKSKKRREQYARFATEDHITMVCTRGVIKRGIDIERVFNVVLIEMGKEFTSIIQMIGRGLRRASDKDYVDIYDLCASTKFSKTHLRARKRFYEEARYPYTVTKVPY